MRIWPFKARQKPVPPGTALAPLQISAEEAELNRRFAEIEAKRAPSEQRLSFINGRLMAELEKVDSRRMDMIAGMNRLRREI